MARDNPDFKPVGEILKDDRVRISRYRRSMSEHQVRYLLGDLCCAIEEKEKDYFIGCMIFERAGKDVLSVADGRKRLRTISMMLAKIREGLGELDWNGAAKGKQSASAALAIDEFFDALVAGYGKRWRERILREWLEFVEERVSVVTACVPQAHSATRGSNKFAKFGPR